MSDLHQQLVEQVIARVEPHIEPMDYGDLYMICADALEDNDFNVRHATFQILLFSDWVK